MKHSKKAMQAGHVGALVIGGVVAAKVATLPIPMVPEKVRPLVPVLVGYLLTRSKNANLKYAGKGMIVVGAVKTVGAFVPQLGISETPGMGDYVISGDDTMMLNGTEDMGYPAALAGSTPGMGYPAALAGMDDVKENVF